MRKFMKKTRVIILLLLQFFLLASTLYGNDTEPLSDLPEWRGIDAADIVFSSLHEKAFVALYKVSEESDNIEKVYKAYGNMRTIFQTHKFDEKYNNSKFINPNPDMILLLKELLAKMTAPETEKEYFLKGLFYKSTSDLKFVIENYPDSKYAKIAYMYLSGYYKDERKKQEAIALLERYLEVYGDDDPLAPYAYYRLGRVYSLDIVGMGLFPKEKKEEDRKKAELTFKYSNKLIEKYPERKSMVGDSINLLGLYYRHYIKDEKKALEYYSKVYYSNKYNVYAMYGAFSGISTIYEKKRDYEKLNEIMENAKSRFPYDKNFRNSYKSEKKRQLKREYYREYDKKREAMLRQLKVKPPTTPEGKVEAMKKFKEDRKKHSDGWKAVEEKFEKDFEKEWPEPPLSQFGKEAREGREKKKPNK
jgi:hypothetical protein